jgi:hypothetical protein
MIMRVAEDLFPVWPERSVVAWELDLLLPSGRSGIASAGLQEELPQ